VQPDGPTIQGLVAAAASGVLKGEVRITGASRTDAGVHALRQTASLRFAGRIPVEALVPALNATLPPDVRVHAAAEASPGFDARRSAEGKRYLYVIDNAPVASPFLRRYAWHVARPLDVPAMREAAAPLRARHDFSAFCAAPGRGQPPECTIRALHVFRRPRRVVLVVSADRFLHHMVRNVVGSLVAVGRGARSPEWVEEVLASRDRRRAGPTAPAQGLALVRVLYPR
jgi:tRNA pseudouridine38-40 synthase